MGVKIDKLTANPAADAGRFVNAAERADLAGQPLRILSVRDDEHNRYGARWLVSVVVIETGEKVALGFAKNAARDSASPTLAAVIAEVGPDGTDPVVLMRQTPAKGGNSFWTFADASDAGTVPLDDADTDDTDDGDTGDAEPVAAPVLTKSRRDRR